MTTIRTIGTYDGQDVREAVLESTGARVAILNYGCVIRDWRVEAQGRAVPCVLGFDSFDPYPEHSRSFGIIAGRVANRIAKGRFTLDGREYQLPVNNGENHLHGGPKGLGKRIWQMDADGDGLLLRYRSPDGEMGYPGNADFEVRFTLAGGALRCEMRATVDRPTPVNLAQHNYYNLNGRGDVLDHVLRIAASRYTPVDGGLIPTGEIAPVEGTHLDFRSPVAVGVRDPMRLGADNNLVLDADRDRDAPAAELRSGETGLVCRIFTDQPAIQLYDARGLDVAVPGLDGQHYGAFGGLCLEAQHYPDAVNHPDFPDVIATPDRPYRQDLTMEIVAG